MTVEQARQKIQMIDERIKYLSTDNQDEIYSKEEVLLAYKAKTSQVWLAAQNKE